MAIRILGTFRRAVIRWTTPKRQYTMIKVPYGIEDGLFPLGSVSVSLRALHTLTAEDIEEALQNHVHGNWGEHTDEDEYQNQDALERGHRLFSGFRSADGVRFVILTPADRSWTTIELFEECSR